MLAIPLLLTWSATALYCVAPQIDSEKKRFPCNRTSTARELDHVSITGTFYPNYWRDSMSTKATVSSTLLAGVVASLLASIAHAAPLTPAEGAAAVAQGEVLRRRAEGAERLRRRSRHDMPRDVGNGLPG
jgi:hypothetical protein